MANIQKNGGGYFIPVRQKFTIVDNTILYDKTLSLNAKALYSMICGRITYTEVPLTKKWLQDHCIEGERAFCTAWDSLKQHGYLIDHVRPTGEHGHMEHIYELRDISLPWDGVYLIYYDTKGNVTKTNLTMKQKDHPLQNHPGGNRTSGDHPSGDRSGGNVGGIYNTNDKTNHKTENNTVVNQSIHPNPPQKAFSDDELQEHICEEVMEKKNIPHDYMRDKSKAEVALRFLLGYDFQQMHPYSQNGVIDDSRQNAFDLLLACLTDMVTETTQQNYNGALVSASNVIDQLNKSCSEWEESGLEDFLESTLDDYLAASAQRKIKNVRKYMKSVIWTSLISFRAKQDAEIRHLLHQAKPA